MQSAHPDKQSNKRRLWRKGERAKVSILQAFRSAFDEGRAKPTSSDQSPATTSEPRSLPKRDALNEATLREHLQADLNALLDTIELGSAVPLDDLPHVRSSIINYGFRDLSNLSVTDIGKPQIKQAIRQSLINHEPRLVQQSIEVDVREPDDDNGQRASISVSAELMGDPIDIPLDFDAEIDMAAGKLKMSKLRIQA